MADGNFTDRSLVPPLIGALVRRLGGRVEVPAREVLDLHGELHLETVVRGTELRVVLEYLAPASASPPAPSEAPGASPCSTPAPGATGEAAGGLGEGVLVESDGARGEPAPASLPHQRRAGEAEGCQDPTGTGGAR